MPAAVPLTRILVVSDKPVGNDEPAALTVCLSALADALASAERSAIRKLLTQRLDNQDVQPLGPTAASRPTAFELRACSSTDAAVTILCEGVVAARPFAVVFLDLPLAPDSGGVWAAEQIRALDSDVAVVLLLDDADADRAEINRRVPPRDKLFYIVKPFQLHEVWQMALVLTWRWYAERSLRPQGLVEP